MREPSSNTLQTLYEARSLRHSLPHIGALWPCYELLARISTRSI